MNRDDEIVAEGHPAGSGESYISKLRRSLTFRLGLKRQPELDIIRSCPLFDASWYQETYPDVVKAQLDPAAHYLEHGGFEGRDPSPYFSSQWYLSTYPDVREANLNPLLHFLTSGHAEGRAPMSRSALMQLGSHKVYEGYGFDPATAPDEDLEAQRIMLQESSLFDPDWYVAAYADLANADLNPLEHFLNTGWRERRNPSAKFDTDWYLRAYADVMDANMNPVIHYLRHGKAEGYLPLEPTSAVKLSHKQQTTIKKAGAAATPEERLAIDTALVSESDLFDAVWYSSTYPVVTKKKFDPAFHYVRFGGFEGMNPSPGFDSQYYTSRMPKALVGKVNPLVHYLREGRADGLKPLAALEFNIKTKRSSAAARLKLQEEEPNRSHMARLLLNQRAICFLPQPADIPQGLLQRMANLIRVFSELSGDGKHSVALQPDETAKPEPVKIQKILPVHTLHTLSGVNGVTFTDAWLSSDYDLQLRLLIDNDVQADTPKTRQVHAFQYAQQGGLELIGAAGGLEAGPGFIRLSLVNPYLPVLLMILDDEGLCMDTQMLPFPSLWRGGAHYGEAAFGAAGASSTEQIRAYSDDLLNEWRDDSQGPLSIGEIEIACQNATGQERIFSPSLRTWIGATLGLTLTAVQGGPMQAYFSEQLLPETSGATVQKRRASRLNESHLTLHLPSDTTPSLSALLSRRLSLPAEVETATTPYVVCHAVTGQPLCSVSLPSSHASAQPVTHDAGAAPYLKRRDNTANPGPLAARAMGLRAFNSQSSVIHEAIPHDAEGQGVAQQVLNDLSADQLRIQAIVSHQTGDDLLTFASSLKRQSLSSHIINLAFVGPEDVPSDEEKALATFFPERNPRLGAMRLNHNMLINKAVSDCTADYLLLCDANILLPDPHTLAHLYKMLTPEDVASAACVVLQISEARKKETVTFVSGGYFPASVNLVGHPSLQLREINSLQAMPDMVYPVVANAFRMTLIKRSVWVQLDGINAARFPERQGEVDFALRAAQLGYRHLVTSMTRAVTANPMQRFTFDDGLSVGRLSVPQWQDILQNSTLIQEF